jgi:hypothetical protein
MSIRSCRKTALVAALVAAPGAWAVEIDGRIDPAEWAGAHHVTDFRKVQPLSGEPGSLATEAWVLATPEGLAVAFRNHQPATVPRTRQRVQRDFSEQVDRINLMVDFDGDGRTGYNFVVASTGGVSDAVITNQSEFNGDWDGHWHHAVSEEGDTWSVEVLIPWYIAPMRGGDGGTRTLKVYLDRVVGSTGERMAWPTASFQRPRFLSDFAPLEVPLYSRSLLAVTPYVSGLYDKVGGRGDGNVGADLFWKPNGQFQLTATLDPDFGQVESDDLVVNFSATETYISDKRPFFTENQGLFEFTTPSDYSQLLYTRRIGGPAVDGRGSGDIDAALKLNGSLGAVKYGLFAAEESGEAGRSFSALRLVRDFSTQNAGVMLTRVERPWLDREATVFGVDHNWRPTARWNIRSRLFGSHIAQAGDDSEDLGATVWADYEMDHGWRQQWMAMHFGDALEINDMGYLSRNDLNYGHWQVSRRFTDLPDDSRYASKDWRVRASSSTNDHGQRIRNEFRLSRSSQLRDGSSEYAQLSLNGSGVDDRLTRGHGVLRLPSNFSAFFEYDRPRKGRWAYGLYGQVFSHGLAGNERLGHALEIQPTWFASDALRVHLGASSIHRPDWLLWRGDNLVGGFDGREVALTTGLDWAIGQRQELRVKLQALAIDARLRQAWRVDPAGRAVASDDPVDDFSVRTLGFQVRYRYELAPLSYLYVVYARGGYRDEPFSESPSSALRDSFDLRDDEQLLVKFSYRFEL